MSEQRTSKTVLGADCRITGEIALESDALILGQFKGTLRVSGVLEIADSAHVVGTIVAGALRVAGRIEANVVAEHGVELLAGAQLSGQLYATTLSVVEGAVLESEVCVGPKAVQAAGAILRQVEDATNNEIAAEGRVEQAQAAAPQAGWQSNASQIESEQIDESAEMQEQEMEEEPEPIVAPVRTIPSTLNSMLSRRRAKVLTGNSLKPADEAHSLKAGPTARAS